MSNYIICQEDLNMFPDLFTCNREVFLNLEKPDKKQKPVKNLTLNQIPTFKEPTLQLSYFSRSSYYK